MEEEYKKNKNERENQPSGEWRGFGYSFDDFGFAGRRLRRDAFGGRRKLTQLTNVLSKTKAYYAAESGLHATINILCGNTDTTPANPNDDDDVDYINVEIYGKGYRPSILAKYNFPHTVNTPSSRLFEFLRA
jgi:hypothetical protein